VTDRDALDYSSNVVSQKRFIEPYSTSANVYLRRNSTLDTPCPPEVFLHFKQKKERKKKAEKESTARYRVPLSPAA
jgi:hypothetical protein